MEIIPQCSPSLLPNVVNDISNFAANRGMELNSKKCKEMVVSFLKYKLSRFDLIHISGIPVVRVSCFKLLGVTISDDIYILRLDTLESRRPHACLKSADKMRCDNQIGINPQTNIFRKIPRANDHNHDFRLERPCRINTNTKRFSNFITVKY